MGCKIPDCKTATKNYRGFYHSAISGSAADSWSPTICQDVLPIIPFLSYVS